MLRKIKHSLSVLSNYFVGFTDFHEERLRLSKRVLKTRSLVRRNDIFSVENLVSGNSVSL